MGTIFYVIKYVSVKKFYFFALFLVYLISPTFGFAKSVTFDDLVVREGRYYKIFSNNPFTGRVVGGLNGEIKNGKWEGVWMHFYNNGPLGSKTYYKNGKKDGPFETYHENGQLLSRGTYANGVLNGIMEIYNVQGQLKLQKFFKQGVEIGKE